jgi:hypothetical protein
MLLSMSVGNKEWALRTSVGMKEGGLRKNPKDTHTTQSVMRQRETMCLMIMYSACSNSGHGFVSCCGVRDTLTSSVRIEAKTEASLLPSLV